MNYGKLAYTGMGTVSIAGVTFDQWTLLGVAAGLVVIGAVLVRHAWRRGKKADVR